MLVRHQGVELGHTHTHHSELLQIKNQTLGGGEGDNRHCSKIWMCKIIYGLWV